MSYSITIASEQEFQAVEWLAERYTYAEKLDDLILSARECTPADWHRCCNPVYPVTFTGIPEHEAWALQSAVEDGDGWLVCLGSRLKTEVETLLNNIVELP